MKTLLACSMLALASLAGAQDAPFPATTLRVGPHRVNAEIADTDARRARGLMGREALPADAGMVFVFGAPATQCLWMKDTPLPLSVAFIGADGRIVNIAEMRPHTLDSHCSTKGVPVLYALEMNEGWFRRRHVAVGMQVGNLPAR